MVEDVLVGGPAGPDRDREAPRPAGELRRRVAALLVRPGVRVSVALLAVLAVLAGAAVLRAGAPAPIRDPGAGTRPAAEPVSPPGALGLDGRLQPDVTLLVLTASGLVRAQRSGERVEVGRVLVGTGPAGPLDAWVTPTSTVVVVPWGGPEGGVVAMVGGGGPPVMVGPATRVLPGPTRDSLWLVRTQPGGGERIGAVGLDGAPRGPDRVVPPGLYVAAVLPHGVVVTAPAPRSRLALWLPDGTLRDLGPGGRVVAAAGRTVLFRIQPCGQRVTCEVRAVDVRTGAVRPIIGPPTLPGLGSPALSRDGTRVAQLVDPARSGRSAQVALAVSTVARGGADLTVVPGTSFPLGAAPDGLVPPAWSADGRVFGALPSVSALYSYLPGEPAARRFPRGAPDVRRVWVL